MFFAISYQSLDYPSFRKGDGRYRDSEVAPAASAHQLQIIWPGLQRSALDNHWLNGPAMQQDKVLYGLVVFRGADAPMQLAWGASLCALPTL